VRFQERELAACDPLRRSLLRQLLVEEALADEEAAVTAVAAERPGLGVLVADALQRLRDLLIPAPQLGWAPTLGTAETTAEEAETLVLPEGQVPRALGAQAVTLPDGREGRVELRVQTPAPGTADVEVRIIDTAGEPAPGVRVAIVLGVVRRPGEGPTDAQGRTWVRTVPLRLLLAQAGDLPLHLQ